MSFRIDGAFQLHRKVKDLVLSSKLYAYGLPLSAKDRLQVASGYSLWTITVCDLDAQRGLTARYAFLYQWIIQLVEVDVVRVAFVAKTGATLVRNLANQGWTVDYDGFKRRLMSACGEEYHGAVVRPLSALFGSDPLDPEDTTQVVSIVRMLLTYFEFISRLTLDDVDQFTIDAIEAYKKFEQEFDDSSYPTVIVQALREELFEGFSDPLDRFLPKHGPGTVVDSGPTHEEKYLKLRDCGLPRDLVKLLCRDGWEYPFMSGRSSPDEQLPCEILFVPKSMSSKRVISRETVARQWAQQGCMEFFVNRLARRYGIHLDDQTKNQSLALRGSYDGSFTTIDLSDASDCVSWTLVRQLFEGFPILRYLAKTRAEKAIVHDTIIPLKKFAPMGSALCFPVMTTILAAIVRVSMRACGIYGNFVVYGDDIVVPSAIAPRVILLLRRLRFRVNSTKTFGPTGFFRESCGAECLYGEHVEPFRLSRFFRPIIRPNVTPETFSQWITLANTAYLSYPLVRAVVVHELLRLFPNLPFKGDSDALAVWSLDARNWHLRTRYENASTKTLQRGRTYKLTTIRSSQSRGSDDLRYEIMLWEYSISDRETLIAPDDLIEVRLGRSRQKFDLAWIPEEILVSRQTNFSFQGSLPRLFLNGTS